MPHLPAARATRRVASSVAPAIMQPTMSLIASFARASARLLRMRGVRATHPASDEVIPALMRRVSHGYRAAYFIGLSGSFCPAGTGTSATFSVMETAV